jgi:signal transduction histidine kinase
VPAAHIRRRREGAGPPHGQAHVGRSPIRRTERATRPAEPDPAWAAYPEGMKPADERRRDDVVDTLLAVVVAAIAVASVLTRATSDAYHYPPPNAALVVLALLASLPLAVRRRRPLAVCLVVMSAVVTIGALSWNVAFTPVLVAFALYNAADRLELRWAAVGLAVAYADIALLVLLRVPYFDNPRAILFVPTVSAAWGLGRWMRRRRAERAEAVARAVEAERVRVIEAERAVLAERLHIARELHDVVSHTLSVIAVQSGTARHRLERGDDGDTATRTVPALSAIEAASRGALEDLRRMLGLLRADPPATQPPAPSTRPSISDRPHSPVREWLVDTTLALVLAALGVAFAFVPDPTQGFEYRPPSPPLVALILVACLPLAVRRRWPLPVFATCLATTVITFALGWNAEWCGLAAYLALYTVAAWRSFPVGAGALALMAIGEGTLWAISAPHTNPWDDLAGSLLPWGIGLAIRQWRQQRDAALDRALQAERTRASTAERAVFAERLRIAGELHDVVAHTLSAVAVQAAVMRHQLGQPTGIAGSTLATIEQASRTALDDLRRMLNILHDDDDERASLSPTPSLAELDVLVSAHRAVGPVELTVDPAVLALPNSVQLAAFRLVQEALTNIRKHAPGAAAWVTVSIDADIVRLTVQDNGDQQPATSGGFGLHGMRERVALFNGSFEAGPHGDGYRIEATLHATLDVVAEGAVTV